MVQVQLHMRGREADTNNQVQHSFAPIFVKLVAVTHYEDVRIDHGIFRTVPTLLKQPEFEWGGVDPAPLTLQVIAKLQFDSKAYLLGPRMVRPWPVPLPG